VPVLIDEIQTFGRTRELFAFQYYQLDDFADVVTIGKLCQVCATLFRAELNPQGPLLSQTFLAGTAALHAARTILNELIGGDYFGAGGRIEQLGDYFLRHLEQLAKRRPGLISDPYGLGAMIGFTPLDGSAELANRFVQALYQAGVIGFVAGQSPARVRFLLPYGALSPADIDLVMERMETTLLAVQTESRTSAPHEPPGRG
jgi:4-aminobutyrate aminotransferase-like enzyme